MIAMSLKRQNNAMIATSKVYTNHLSTCRITLKNYIDVLERLDKCDVWKTESGNVL